MHREELEADKQLNVYMKLNTSISMISVQYNRSSTAACPQAVQFRSGDDGG